MRTIAILLLALLCHLPAGALSHFNHRGVLLLTEEEGLANNTLTEIHQDKDGFLWLGTDVGLSRYDGIHFHNYRLSGTEPLSVARICETPDQLLWLRTRNRSGIACFDKMHDCFLTVSIEGEASADVEDLCVANGRLYAIMPEGLARLEATMDGETVKLSVHRIPEVKGDFQHLHGCGKIVCLLAEDGRMAVFHTDSRKVDQLSAAALGLSRISEIRRIRCLNEILWICDRQAGLIGYDLRNGTARNLTSEDREGALRDIDLQDMARVNDSTFVVATHASLSRLEFEGSDCLHASFRIHPLTEYDSSYSSIIRGRITRILYDKKNQVLWTGTFGRGLLKLNLQKENVHRIRLAEHIHAINGIAQDANGYVWLATEKDGIYKSTTKDVTPETEFAPWGGSDGGYCLSKDRNGQLWFGNSKGEIFRVSPVTGETTSYRPLPDGKEENASPVSALVLNSRNILWIATQKGLVVFDCQANKCLAHLPYSKETKEVTALCEDGDGTIWLGTEKGVASAKREGNRIALSTGYEAEAGLTPGRVLSLYLNSYNQLFASYADKVVQIDGKEKAVAATMILQKGLPGGHVSCMVDDKNGNTWMGTNSGIVTVNNKSGSSYSYGFPENYFDVCRLNNGKLLWAGSTGLTYFDPHVLKEEAGCCPLYVSDIDVNYKPVEVGEKVNGQVILKQPAHLTQALTLKHDNNNLTVYLTDLKYGPAPGKAEYRLLPGDEQWRQGGEQIRLSNLKPGDYVLEARAACPMEESGQVLQLPIRVRRHWAATGWAVAGYVTLLALVCLLTWLYFERKARERELFRAKENKLKEQLVEETEIREKEEKNHRMRDQVRYTLAQELRSPLALVAAPLKEMLDDEAFPDSLKQKAKVAYRNSINMQDICNQLLDIHQQESYGPQLHVASYSAGEIADEVVRSSYELLNASPINLTYDKENRISQEIWIDRKRITFVLRNILSNAYRHISYSGAISFDVKVSCINGRDFCLFTVEDDGKQTARETSVTFLGASEEASPSNDLHPEVGIEIMRETAMAHGGDIRIQQEKDKGTKVTLYLPLGRQHLEGKDHVSFTDPEAAGEPGGRNTPILTADEKEVEVVEHEETAIVRPVADRTNSRYKVLVVEDNADIRLYLKVLLAPNYDVYTAENGEEGVKMARREQPDLVLTDVMMPVMNGYECCRTLKEDLKTCHIPVVMLTALVDDNDVVRGIELGADDYILKPFNPEILRSKVRRIINSRAELKQIYTNMFIPAMMGKRDGEEEEEKAIEDPFIRQVLVIIKDNMQDPDFGVKRLADILHISQPTLYRRVKQATDYSIVEFIRGIRLKRAAELLKTKQYSVQEVAEEVGYSDLASFRKSFAEFYGFAPSKVMYGKADIGGRR